MNQRNKKKLGVWLSAGVALVWLLLQGLLLLAVAALSVSFLSVSFLLLEGVLIALGIGLLLAARSRIQEINGGEEDDLSQY